MQRIFLKSKIHRARVTDKNLNYEGSLTIDENLMKKADILPGEFVQVINVTNGNRFETYVMRGEPNSGAVFLNGRTARRSGRRSIHYFLLSFRFSADSYF